LSQLFLIKDDTWASFCTHGILLVLDARIERDQTNNRCWINKGWQGAGAVSELHIWLNNYVLLVENNHILYNFGENTR